MADVRGARGRLVLGLVPIVMLLSALGCDNGNSLPSASSVRELSDAQRLSLCEDSAERLLAARDREVRCTQEAIVRGPLSVGPECEQRRAACLASDDDQDDVDAVTGASVCAGQDVVPGASCDLTVGEYSRCVGLRAERVRRQGDGCGSFPPLSPREEACLQHEGCGFFD